MLQVEPSSLPLGSELPSSDDTPVDNENQNFIPNYLLFLLERIWAERNDWYFGVDMGVYHTTGASPLVPIVPDGFLSLGVPRRRGGSQRLNYVVWEEGNVVPQFALEIVSKTYNDEYERWLPKQERSGKLGIYENLGVTYYVIYNPDYWQRDRHQPLEIYKLVEGRYQLQIGEPYWMPEIRLGLGRCLITWGGLEREVLSWFDETGDRYLSSEEIAQQERDRALQAEAEREQERERAERERERADRLAAKLRELGVDLDEV